MKKVKVIREKSGEEVTNERMDIIAQNGNEGLHYEQLDGAPLLYPYIVRELTLLNKRSRHFLQNYN